MKRTLVACLVLLAAAACSHSTADTTEEKAGAVAASPSPPSQQTPRPTPAADDEPIVPPHGTFGALSLTHLLTIYPKIDGSVAYSFNTNNPLKIRTPLLVTGARRDPEGHEWIRVQLPFRPNGHQAWVRAAEVKLIRENQRIVVDLSSRTLRWWNGGKLVKTLSVGIGTSTTPTTTGTYFVWEKVPQANPFGPYGSYALGLSAFSAVEKNWPGGGRIGIHGTPFASDQGNAVSHGCVRVYNPQMLLLRSVPLGTPVTIRP
jgi:lipoprotein-anchoring transpeptidase ErfK/SrfK